MKLSYKLINAMTLYGLFFNVFFCALNADGSDVMNVSKKENYIAERVSQNAIKVERLQVNNLVDYGISLHTASNFQEDFKPEFVDQKIKQDFFDHWNNQQQKVGWRLFCDCKGEYFQKNGRDYFRVYEAKFFLVPNEIPIETVKNPEYIQL